jgi:hypothetical protein
MFCFTHVTPATWKEETGGSQSEASSDISTTLHLKTR